MDLQTKRDSENFIKFNYKGHCEFKGKSISLPIFEPVDPVYEAMSASKTKYNQDVYLKLHSNPFLIDKHSECKSKQNKQVGREDLLSKIAEDLFEFFDPDFRPEMPYTLAILGEPGMGKTLFVRCLIEKLAKKKGFLRDR